MTRDLPGRPTADSIKKPKKLNKTPNPLDGVRKNSVKDKDVNSSKSQGKSGKPRGGGSLQKTAKRLTNGIVRDEVNDLRAQRREVNRSARHSNAAVRAQYQHGEDDIKAVHATTGGYINAQNAQSQAGFDAASVEQNAAAAALQAQLQNVYAAGEGSATAELSRLGITGGDPSSFLGQLASDSANAQALGAQTANNNASNLSAMQANAGSVGSLLSSMNQGSAMSGIGQNLNARNAGFAENRGIQNQQLQAVREAIQDAKGTRKDTFLQLLTQLKQSGWGRR